ncbi:hypothetical protein AALA90_19905 [Lachnospiraceae bacterium 38-10]
MGLTVRFKTDAVNEVSGLDAKFLKEKNPNRGSGRFFYCGEEDYIRVLPLPV